MTQEDHRREEYYRANQGRPPRQLSLDAPACSSCDSATEPLTH